MKLIGDIFSYTSKVFVNILIGPFFHIADLMLCYFSKKDIQ